MFAPVESANVTAGSRSPKRERHQPAAPEQVHSTVHVSPFETSTDFVTQRTAIDFRTDELLAGEGTTMRLTPTISSIFSLILTGLLASTSAHAGDVGHTDESSDQAAPTRAEFLAAQNPGVDAAVHAIVRELAAVGTGPRETRVSNPAPGIGRSLIANPVVNSLANPGMLRGLGLVSDDAPEALADDAAAARALPGADEGGDDHAM